tara:strand:- start:768 stop:1031 length:264 start_codon:yes stop_codon:yes gene_type:complete
MGGSTKKNLKNKMPKMTKQIKDGINDKFMMNECSELTGVMLNVGMDINKVCGIIKEYQTKYLFIKSQDEDLAKLFTWKMWWKTRGNE